ncbi:efflux RND transporter periplasmic adaptor subunit [Zunongwangia atlantica]|uniref:Macrolide-specific membrane fusion protein n=1 Tax=Zunongwangia atlantica 22II14-10F7 TaxID=1185767 RepID=A0A1Y1SYV9_9FLAO|nr:efflux RND transporter periplasmic adaptor subunit [Zunongwangia atlantica]ORL43584.1 Macrolide-specific membrane fusion protein [Zunongwangia atlantica 22II14-10F7]
MKKNKNKIIIAVVAIIIIMAAYFFFSRSDTGKITVETVRVKEDNITNMVTATGTVEPLTEVEVGTQVSGEVDKIYVDYNSEVKKGDLLAEIDKTNLISSLQQAQANYNNAVTERDYYKKIYTRQKSLFEQEVISQSDYDDAEYNYNNSQTAVTQALSTLQEAKTDLGYADIYSPIDGVVLSVEVDEGQTVAASFETPTLFTIAKDLREMQVEADVDEADIGQVDEGQRVSFTVDAYPTETFEGEVTQVRLNPTEEENVITYTVVIKAQNPDLKLKPGLTATVAIYYQELKDIPTIEAKAVNFQPNNETLKTYESQNGLTATMRSPEEDMQTFANGNTTVWVLQESGKIISKKVNLGASDGVNVQVLDGLALNEKVVYGLKEKNEVSVDGARSPFMPGPPGSDDEEDKDED